ncbi:hypothetical protein [Nostoc sp.]|uniref:hypothetical protein n=1 Tax=Nostoc sp. TaxID=1180 RepID=UPI002FF649DD
MKTEIVEQVELFSQEEIESLELLPEELEAIEAELVPNLENIYFEDIAEDLEAAFEQHSEAVLESSPFNKFKKLTNKRRRRSPSGSPPGTPPGTPPGSPRR